MTNRSILMADDDAHDLFLLQRAFRDAKLSNPLFSVSDGQEAIDFLSGSGKFAERRPPVPSLLLLDLKMPRKTGFDVLRWLRASPDFRWLPAVIFSSSAQPTDVRAAYEGGANAFIVKPSGIQRRADLVRTLVSFWLEYNEPPAAS